MKRLIYSLMTLLLANCARADLFLHEPFDGSSTDSPLGWAADSVWEFTNRSETVVSTCEPTDEGLQFGRLVTSGGAMLINTGNNGKGSLSRPMDIPKPDSRKSVWMSFVFHYSGPSNSATYNTQEFGVRFMHADDSTYTFQDYPLYAGTWDKEIRQGLDANGKDISGDTWLEPPVSGQDYLVLCAITNIALGNWNSDKATELRSWVLDPSRFERVLATGALDSKTPPSQEEFMSLLDTNCVAVSSEQSWGSWGTGNLNSDDRFQLYSAVNMQAASYVVDELRMGDAYKDVLPLYPPSRGGTMIILR